MSRRSVVVALGNLDILPISDGVVKMTAAELIRPAGNNQNAWDRHPELEQGKATWELPLGGFLIRTSNRLILVDAGIGPIDNGVFRGGALLNALQVLGVEAGQITDVLLTHLHFDHIGWVSQRGVPTFPNATIRCHAQDWQWFVEGEEADEHVVRKLSSVLENVEVFETDCSLTKGVSVRHSPGHTPGSTIVVFQAVQSVRCFWVMLHIALWNLLRMIGKGYLILTRKRPALLETEYPESWKVEMLWP